MLGDRPLGSIRRSDIQTWVKGRSEVLAPGSVELIYRWVSTVFKATVADRLIPSSPCISIKLPPRDKGEIVPMLASEVDALADAIAPRYRALVLFAAGTGMRQGECFGLTVDRVDFLRRQVRVDRQLLNVKGGNLEWGAPKSSAGFRTIPLPKVVTDALAAHLKQFGEGPERLVFTNSFGSGLRRSPFNEAWHRATEQLGLAKSVTFHDLRHFYAWLLIAHGCSVKAVQRRLGHQSAMETLDTYSHLWPDSDDETRDAVDLVLGSREAAS